MARFKRAYPGRPYIHQGPSPAQAAPAVTAHQAAPFVFRSPYRHGSWVGKNSGPYGGTAVPPQPLAPAITLEMHAGRIRRSVPARARAGPYITGGGRAVPHAPLGTPGPVMPPMTWMGGAGYRPHPHGPWVGRNYGPYGGITGPLLVTTTYQRSPIPFKRPAPARAVWRGGTGLLLVTAAYQRPPVQVRRPARQLGQAGPYARAVGAGRAGSPAFGAAYQPRPFVARSPAPHRAAIGPRAACAAGVAVPAPPLGAPPSPAPRPVIQHLPPHRAKVGPGTYVAAGHAVILTSLGFQSQPPPRPVIAHIPPARARLGQRGLAAGGVPSTAPPLGSPSQPAPRPVIRHLPSRRAQCGPRPGPYGGIASHVVPQLGSPPPARKVPQFPPKTTRARVGPGMVAGGATGLANLPPGPTGTGTAAPAVSITIGQRRVTRALTGHSQTAGGITAPAASAVRSPYQRPPVQIKRSVPARGRAGRGQVAGGLTGPAPVLVTTAYKRPAPQIRRPAPARAWIGCGTGTHGLTGSPQLAVQRIWPYTAGPPADAADVTAYSLGVQFTLSYPAQFTGIWFWRAVTGDKLPSTGAIFQVTGPGAGTVIPGTTVTFTDPGTAGWIKAPSSAGVTLSAGVAYKAVVQGPATAGNWYSATAHYWDTGPGATGITTGTITAPSNAGADGGQDTFTVAGSLTYPASSFNATNYWVDVEVLGPFLNIPAAYQRPAPYIKRPAAARARLGPYGAPAGGAIGLVNLPYVGTPGAYQRTLPYIKRPARNRAWVGGATGPYGGQPGHGPLGFPQYSLPVVPGRLPPPLTRALWRGIAAPAAPPAAQAHQRPAPYIKRRGPDTNRAILGPRSAPAGGQPGTFPPAPPQPPRAPIGFRPPAPRRALWRGTVVLSANQPAQAYQQPLPAIKRLSRRKPNPAAIGFLGRSWGGNTGLYNLIPSPYQRPPVQIRRPAPARGIWHGGTRPAPFITAYQRPGPQVKRPAPARAAAGPRGTCGAGISSPVVSPLGSPPPLNKPLPPQSRRPAPARGVGHGIASQAVGFQAAFYQRPAPYIKRPAAARARLGPYGAPAGGIASRLVPQFGTVPPPRRLLNWVPRPCSRAKAGPAGTPGAGQSGPLLVTTAYQRPAPYIKRSMPTRAVWRGNAGLYNIVPTLYQRPPVQIRRPAPARAVWHSGIGTGNQPAQLYQRPPVQIRRPAPARGIWRTGTGPAHYLTAYQRSAPQIQHLPPARARLGPRGTCAGGVASSIIGLRGTQLGRQAQWIFRSPLPRRGQNIPRRVIGLSNLAPPIVPGVTGTASPQDLTGTATALDPGIAIVQNPTGMATKG